MDFHRTNVSTSVLSLEKQFEIVPAEFEDMELVSNFIRSSAHWYRPIVDKKDMGEHDVDEKWAEINFQRRDFYIGIANDKPIGTISLQCFGKFAYLGYIYLDIEHVGKGYGQQLMQFAESIARDKGMSGMALIAHPKATWAKRAYLKYGFEIVSADKQEILFWQQRALKPYYEEGFELYIHEFSTYLHSNSQKTFQESPCA